MHKIKEGKRPEMLMATAYKTLGKKYLLCITYEPNFSLKLQFKYIFLPKKVHYTTKIDFLSKYRKISLSRDQIPWFQLKYI